jgi:hypothetical protein
LLKATIVKKETIMVNQTKGVKFLSSHAAASLVALLLTLSLVACSTNNVQQESAEVAVSLEEFQRVAVWNEVLQRHPDLPKKVATILVDHTREIPTDIPDATAWLHTTEKRWSLPAADSIKVIVTDLDHESLRRLLEFWQTVPGDAEDFGIPEPPAADRPLQSHAVDILILSAEGSLDAGRSDGRQTQPFDLFPGEMTEHATLQFHAFGVMGEFAYLRMAEYIRTARSTRRLSGGDPESGKHETPASGLKIVAVGGFFGSENERVTIQPGKRSGPRAVLADAAAGYVSGKVVDGAAEAFKSARVSRPGGIKRTPRPPHLRPGRLPGKLPRPRIRRPRFRPRIRLRLPW